MKQLGPVELWDETVWLCWMPNDCAKSCATDRVFNVAPERSEVLPVAQGTDTSMVEDRCKQCLFGGAGSTPAAERELGVEP